MPCSLFLHWFYLAFCVRGAARGHWRADPDSEQRRLALLPTTPPLTWDATTGACLSVLRGHSDWVLSASYSADGTRIVSASLDRTVRVWDATTGA